jgi:NAD(P)H-binding
MNILVITPDGDIGHQVVADLLSPEFTLRLITDHPADLPEEWREQMEVIAGPADNIGMLRRALAGVASVLWCLPAGTDQKIGQFARALSRAMRDAGTSRLVTVSMTGCGLVRGQDIISSQAAIEDILNKSGAMIRHFRCSHLIEKRFSQGQSILEKGTFSRSTSGNIPVPLVEADDIVDLILRCLVRQDWEGIERKIGVEKPVERRNWRQIVPCAKAKSIAAWKRDLRTCGEERNSRKSPRRSRGRNQME